MKIEAEKHKKLSDLKDKFVHLTKCRKWEEAIYREVSAACYWEDTRTVSDPQSLKGHATSF